MVKTYVEEAYRCKQAFEINTGVEAKAHKPAILQWCTDQGITYPYADQNWYVVIEDGSYTLLPILH